MNFLTRQGVVRYYCHSKRAWLECAVWPAYAAQYASLDPSRRGQTDPTLQSPSDAHQKTWRFLRVSFLAVNLFNGNQARILLSIQTFKELERHLKQRTVQFGVYHRLRTLRTIISQLAVLVDLVRVLNQQASGVRSDK